MYNSYVLGYLLLGWYDPAEWLLNGGSISGVNLMLNFHCSSIVFWVASKNFRVFVQEQFFLLIG